MEAIERVRATFEKDRFATENGAVIDRIGDHFAACSLTIDERHFNAVGTVMGGVPFMLADFTFAVASNWQKPGTVSLNSTITFLGVAKGTRLLAEANCIKNGKSTCCYRIDVHDDLSNPVAAVMITGYHKG